MKTLMRSMLFGVGLWLVWAEVEAQGFTVAGVVMDGESREVLSGANVQLGDREVATDAQGRFRFSLVTEGEGVISTSHVGYQVYRSRILVNENLDLKIRMARRILPGQEMVITADRAVERETPVAFADMNRETVEKLYWAQDVPMLLMEMPGVYSYSDAGNGIGYSYLKIRGFDQKRVGVMVNGIPLNDPEDHQVYWVDLPDLLSSIEDVQVQRGVTNSLYGTSAFGGSVNLVTSTLARESGISASVGTGSYGTRKFSLVMNSGVIDHSFSVHGRFSKIVSDGYRDRSGVDQWAYFLGFEKYGEGTTTRLNVYGGPELAYAAWDAVREDLLEENRKRNPTSEGYDNTIDNFNQPHYELIHEWRPAPELSLNNTLFYIQGEGYYEGLKTERKLKEFGFQNILTRDPELFGADSLDYYETAELDDGEVLFRDEDGKYLLKRTDLVRQKWVEKDQIGWIGRAEWKHHRGKLTVGGEVSNYDGEHWGKVVWAAGLSGAERPDLTYYTYHGDKLTGALYAHELYDLGERLKLMGDLQVQFNSFQFAHKPVGNFVGPERNEYQVDNTFVNPRIGVNYNFDERLNAFVSVALAQREPADDDYYDTWDGPDDLGVDPLFARSDTVFSSGQVENVEWEDPLIDPEKVIDYELGVGYRAGTLSVKANAYWMDFRNEIIPFGQVDDDGNPLRGNADRTVHRGLELALATQLTEELRLSGNLAFSQNYYSDFTFFTWDENWDVVPLDYSGNSIPLFPGRLANLRLSYARAGATADVHAQHVGRQYLDNTEDEERSLDPFTLLNLGFSYDLKRFTGVQGVRLDLRLNNALDKEYSTSGYYDAWEGANFLYPAATRNFYVSLTAEL